MAIDEYAFTAEDVKSRLHGLFEAAKAVDEFEFGCTLLRVRGMESAGWDPFGETHQLVEDLMTLVGAPLVPHTKVRLGLLLYSHLTETGATYDILANLTRVVTGERYVIDPFLDHYPRNRKGEQQFLTTPPKVRALKEMLGAVDQAAVSETLDWFFHASVRNAFAHADYTLHGDEFRTRSEFFERGGVRTPALPLDVPPTSSTARWRSTTRSCASTTSSAAATAPTRWSEAASAAASTTSRWSCWPTSSAACTASAPRRASPILPAAPMSRSGAMERAALPPVPRSDSEWKPRSRRPNRTDSTMM